MENKLRKLFDYQRFAQNDDLKKMIRDCEDRYVFSDVQILPDVELSMATGGKKDLTADEELAEVLKNKEGTK
ncbi:MAG: hypothetical protein IJI92_02715 [Erysipelotrichaceae bacterium]|nr:hypothetical protein [Erysipelotrichaceae bacterium]